jgi:hypothetical protein
MVHGEHVCKETKRYIDAEKTKNAREKLLLAYDAMAHPQTAGPLTLGAISSWSFLGHL